MPTDEVAPSTSTAAAHVGVDNQGFIGNEASSSTDNVVKFCLHFFCFDFDLNKQTNEQTKSVL